MTLDELRSLLKDWESSIISKWIHIRDLAHHGNVSVPIATISEASASVRFTLNGMEITAAGKIVHIAELPDMKEFPLERLNPFINSVREFLMTSETSVKEAVVRRMKALENDFKEIKVDVAEWVLVKDSLQPKVPPQSTNVKNLVDEIRKDIKSAYDKYRTPLHP